MKTKWVVHCRFAQAKSYCDFTSEFEKASDALNFSNKLRLKWSATTKIVRI